MDNALYGINSSLWCQSSSVGDNEAVGSWKFPNGSIVYNDDSSGSIHMMNAAGQVGLLRDGPIDDEEGHVHLYHH